MVMPLTSSVQKDFTKKNRKTTLLIKKKASSVRVNVQRSVAVLHYQGIELKFEFFMTSRSLLHSRLSHNPNDHFQYLLVGTSNVLISAFGK